MVFKLDKTSTNVFKLDKTSTNVFKNHHKAKSTRDVLIKRLCKNVPRLASPGGHAYLDKTICQL